MCAFLNLPVTGTIPFGVHGDAVPVLGIIRKASLDFITVNLPSCYSWTDRVPFTTIQTKYVQQETKDEIWRILMWSASCLKNGKFPECRHDGSAWIASDKERAKLQGDLPAKGILAEVRGDWDWLNQWLQMPTWNTKSGMCWLCGANFHSFSSQSLEERKTKKSRATFLHLLRGMGRKLSPFWEWPENWPSNIVCVDWLHACDQGIGSDIAGQVLCEVGQALPGNSFRERVSCLWGEILQHYKTLNVEYRFATITPEILNKGKKPVGPPTLKGPAAQVSHLVPLLPILANKHLDSRKPHQLAVQKLARFLAKAYAAMECHDTTVLPRAGQKVAQQYIELEKEALQIDPDDTKSWHIMPKLHLFLHLCEMGFPVKDFWCYKDETMGGILVKLCTRRGGKGNPGHNSFEVLDRWMCTTPFPSEL